jgi:signal transduction histidine kinase
MSTQPTLDLSSKTILIVDDNPTNLAVIASYLEQFSLTILIARDGESGLEKAVYARPDLILLDVMMPGLNGFETCRQLKANPVTTDIPVIFMTALASTEDKIKGFEAGGVDYVTKPIQHEEIFARITTHLRLSDLAQRLQSANQELTQLNAHKDKLFSIVAHDLKGPFVPVLGNAELLVERWDIFDTAEKIAMCVAIKQSSRRVVDLLDNLLQWSRMQLNRTPFRPEMLNLHRLVAANIDLLSHNGHKKGVILENLVDSGQKVYADDNMANTILRNLISNAIKYTAAGGKITVSAAPITTDGRDFVAVSVQDNGIGISVEDQEKLFQIETHHTTPGTAQEKGTGLGLIICKEMVESHHGQICVESEQGKGTTFTFTLPQSIVMNDQ